MLFNYGKFFGLRGPAILLALLVAMAAPALADPLPEAFLGKFRGAVTGGAGAAEGEFTLVTKAQRGGFLMTWPPNRSAGFEPSDSKNIFRATLRGRLIEGAPAFWARLEEGRLTVYSMQIDAHGGYEIYTYIFSPENNGLDMVVRHLRSGSQPLESTARLTRYE